MSAFNFNNYYESPYEFFWGITVNTLRRNEINDRFSVCFNYADCNLNELHVFIGNTDQVLDNDDDYFIIRTKY